MYRNMNLVVSLMALVFLPSVSAFGANIKGMIINRTGETLIVKGDKGTTTVVLTDTTRTKDNTGLFGLDREHMADVVLIPGLKVDIDGTSSNGRFIAKTITVDGDDLETSEMIEAGIHPTAKQVDANMQAIEANKQNISTNKEEIDALKRQVAERTSNPTVHEQKETETIKVVEQNEQRFSALADYDTKGENTVKFASGSSTIPAEYEEPLKELAKTATGLKGYIIEVTGFADATGNAAMNTKLSEDRAKAVVTFLMQQGGVPVRHIVAPGAMGEYGPAASNETSAGRADNRRVEIKILVNKGIAGA
jgi:OmpA-OmpF porin, OOP family